MTRARTTSPGPAVLQAAAVLLLLLGVTLPLRAAADCTSEACVPGGGLPETDCHAEFKGQGLRLNFPPLDPRLADPRKRQLRCFDGDAGCDADGAVNGECLFEVDVCLGVSDPDLPQCTPEVPASVVVKQGPVDDGALQAAVDALPRDAGTVCTEGQTLRVPLHTTASGRLRKAAGAVRLRAGEDVDKLQLVCVPRRWPAHGYDHSNRRATPLETEITPANVATLELLWDRRFDKGVTATPTVSRHFVYAASWDGKVYALRRETGDVAWSFDTGTADQLGVQSSVTLTADGRALFGDSQGRIHALHARRGRLLWQGTVGDTDPEHAHVWASPTVANNRVFLGRASHNDVPCTRGHLYAFDLDTGEELWRFQTVPERVCEDDTQTSCETDADCGGGACVDGQGGGVTATVGTDSTGETVYMASVGCYTFPSIGNSDSIFSLDASDGSVNWIHRTQSIEQFEDGPPYHDYGFLNGPIRIDDGTTRAVVAAGKDGVIYARDPDTGAEVWTNVVADVAGGFAGFGLFNGAPGFWDGRLIASLYQFIDGGPAGINHLQAFRSSDGLKAWEGEVDIGGSWGSLAIANGVAFVGTIEDNAFYAFDAASGALLHRFELPADLPGTATTSGASIVDGTLYIGYGLNNPGGVLAYGLPEAP